LPSQPATALILNPPRPRRSPPPQVLFCGLTTEQRDLYRPYPPPPPPRRPFPPPSPQVLFCGLTQEQRDLYRAYLASGDVADILAGSRNALQGLDILRKVGGGGGGGCRRPFGFALTLRPRPADAVCSTTAAPSRPAPLPLNTLPSPTPPHPPTQICNHPDLLERVAAQGMEDYGNPAR
jgi:SNF2 family DNA or RNA helicase